MGVCLILWREILMACLLEEAAQGSYEKAGRLSGGEGSVSRETVMRHVHGINLSPYRKEEEAEKRRVKYLYVEADEDHIALQFHKKKGDIKRWKGHGDNSQIIKLVYVHEGYKEGTGKRRQLKEAVYFGGLYGGKENGKLWEEVKDYIRERYDTEALERNYFQSDGGSWMKKGTEMPGATFVLDEKYVKRMARAAGDPEKEKVVIKYLERGRQRNWGNGQKIKVEERIFSAKEMINWEKRSRKRNGKYVEALQTRVSRQIGMKVYFQAAISRICG